MIHEEATANQRSVVTVWLDYQKAFDSMPHIWITENLKLAKVPPTIVEAIKQLLYKWKTQAHLRETTISIKTEFINYLRNTEGDTRSLILFVLSVNPLSFLLKKHNGYKIRNTKQHNVSHLFFVDDPKLYARNIKKMVKTLATVTMFSQYIGMTFGLSKCAYQSIKREKRKAENKQLVVNNLNIEEIEEGDQYKYLGTEESVGIIGPLNKEKVIKEYNLRVKKIWNSELNGLNKSIAHNAFAVPVITQTIGILNWTKKEISDLDITTHKILTMAGALDAASDVDRLYM